MKKYLLILFLLLNFFICYSQDVRTYKLEANVYFIELKGVGGNEIDKQVKQLINNGWILKTVEQSMEENKTIYLWKLEKKVLIKNKKDK